MGSTCCSTENVRLEREQACIYLSGIDDAHYYRVDNMEKSR